MRLNSDFDKDFQKAKSSIEKTGKRIFITNIVIGCVVIGLLFLGGRCICKSTIVQNALQVTEQKLDGELK